MPFVFVENKDNDSILRSNRDCPYQRFHAPCLSLNSMEMPKTWYCPHCCRLPQFKKKRNARKSQLATFVSDEAVMKHFNICKAKPSATDKLVRCHGERCKNGKYFHLACLGLKRMQTTEPPGNTMDAERLTLPKPPTPLPLVLLHQIHQVVRIKVMLFVWKSLRVKLIRPVHWQI